MDKIDEIAYSITGCSFSNIEQEIPLGCDKNLIKQAYSTIIAGYLNSSTKSSSPWLVNISGIPGSGKSTYIKNNFKDCKNCTVVAFDDIMENQLLPYSKEAQRSQREAFARWELPARIAGYELLGKLIRQEKNILFEHSSSIPQHVTLFEELLKIGYQVHFKYIEVELEEAQRRLALRPRKVPRSYLPERKNL